MITFRGLFLPPMRGGHWRKSTKNYKEGNGIENLMPLPECSFELVSDHKGNKIFIYVSSLTRKP
jgi:hypothetical protein